MKTAYETLMNAIPRNDKETRAKLDALMIFHRAGFDSIRSTNMRINLREKLRILAVG